MGPGHPAGLSCWSAGSRRSSRRCHLRPGHQMGTRDKGLTAGALCQQRWGSRVGRGLQRLEALPAAALGTRQSLPLCPCPVVFAHWLVLLWGKACYSRQQRQLAEHVCAALIDCIQFLISFSRRSIILPAKIRMLVFSCSVGLIFLSPALSHWP